MVFSFAFAQTAGEVRYSAGKLQFHDGTAWVDTVADTGSGVCTSAGSIQWYGAASRIEFCDGANWKSTDSGVNDVTCTGSGQIRYNATDSDAEFCNGTNWRKMVGGTAPCTLPWGGSIAHGAAVTAYATSGGIICGNCNSQLRTCNNGVLSGTYVNETCSTPTCDPGTKKCCEPGVCIAKTNSCP